MKMEEQVRRKVSSKKYRVLTINRVCTRIIFTRGFILQYNSDTSCMYS